MKLLRFLAAALVAGGLAHAPAALAVSAAAAKPLKDASELLRAGKAKEALARLNAVPAAGPDDAYLVDRIRGAAYQRLGDNAAAAQALEAAFATGKVPGAEAGALAESIAAAYAQAKNNAKALQWVEKARAAGDNSATLRELQGYLQGAGGDYATIARESAAAIQAAESAGRRPSEDDLLRLADAYRRTGNKAGDLQVKEKLALNYPANRQYAGIYLADLPGKPGFSPRFSLDLLRLRLATGNLGAAADYMEMAQQLLQVHLPAEAKVVVDKGYAAGALGTGPEAPRQQRLRDLTAKMLADQKASLAVRMATAEAAKDGNDLIELGDEYASLGDDDKAVALIQQGIAKDTLKRPEDAKLRLGVAMLRSGKNRPKALQVLRGVQGGDGAPEIARLYAAIGTGS
jgi:hypothetical protein